MCTRWLLGPVSSQILACFGCLDKLWPKSGHTLAFFGRSQPKSEYALGLRAIFAQNLGMCWLFGHIWPKSGHAFALWASFDPNLLTLCFLGPGLTHIGASFGPFWPFSTLKPGEVTFPAGGGGVLPQY